MKNGTILLQKVDPKNIPNTIEGFFYKAIIFFTGSTFLHALIYCDGKTWDSTFYTTGEMFKGKFTLFSGVRKRKTIAGHAVALEPVTPMTEKEKENMIAYMKKAIENKRPYNLLRLIAMAFVYPTRWFWNWIRWVPFSKDIYGEFCSSFVDEAWEAAGRDIIPNSKEELTAPVDFLKLIEYGTFKQVTIE
jgi:hypothetical protein